MASKDQPSGNVTVLSLFTGKMYQTTVSKVDAAVQQAGEDDAAAKAADEAAYFAQHAGRAPAPAARRRKG